MSDSTPDVPADALPDTPLVTPDAMARILEPRVRSNAKNNPRAAKNAASKPLRAPEIPAAKAPEDDVDAPTTGEIEVPREDVPGFGSPLIAMPTIAAPATAATAASGLDTELTPDGLASSLPTKLESAASALEIAPQAAGDTATATLSEVRDLLLELQEEQQKRDRAFDLLHDELSGYKNDFYLERLKPTLRSLLFLLDSIEDFERETKAFEISGEAPPSNIVRANLIHFRDQLTDILTISDMTPIEPENDRFDPKIQRAIEVVRVEPAQNNTVQRQVRGGWRLGGKMLRAADVVVGRS